ncbi:MAG: amidohydrolase family protein, partial [Enhydrobacter sp.]
IFTMSEPGNGDHSVAPGTSQAGASQATPTPAAASRADARGTTRKTPHWRGVTLLHELKAHGLKVAIGGDNVRDPFYAYGDHDMLESFTQAVKIAHLDHPYGDWITAATSIPAEIMQFGGKYGRIGKGRSADLIVLKARDYGEMLSRFQADRVVIRGGKAIDTTLPDYRELDDLVRVAAPA